MRTFLCATLLAVAASAQGPPVAQHLDSVVQQAIQEGRTPGAVVLIGHKGQVVYRKAYGKRSLLPEIEAMTLDTIFDCASLTKVISTTSSVMKLFEQGKIRLEDKVTEYIPEFQGGTTDITVRNLLTHFSGLRPDLDLDPPWSGYQTGIHLAAIDKPVAPPGTKFIYSDINFILLGEIVRRVSGEMVSEFARKNIFLPLGMNETTFQPPAALKARIAPTERIGKNGDVLRGVVHDETTRFMGGIAGHAGMFSTADDLARFAEMMLGRGERNGVRLFSPLTVAKFTTPQSPANQPILRGLGWDIDSPLSSERGELFPIGSYGHTGFTGTSIWIDPASDTYVILLSNSVHPFRRKPINSLRSKVATVVAAAYGVPAPGVLLAGYNETVTGSGLRREVARNGEVFTGLDVAAQNGFQQFTGKRIGLITNQTGIDRDGVRNIDRMRQAGVRIAKLFSPEHGIAGALDQEHINDTADAATGIPVISLFADPSRRPTPAMLSGLDALVFDIQDVGTRFYTYVSTMAYGMEEAARARIPFYVLDRPNPITGVHVEGPLLDPDKLSFVGYFPMPLRHGMTAGELAAMFNSEKRIGADLRVIAMTGWQRGDWFDSTGLPRESPSPNIRSLTEALLYPGVAMLEYAKNYSVGRGTDSPFEVIGADFLRGREFSSYLNRRLIPGVRVYPARLRPASSTFAGTPIEGVRFLITDREALDAGRLGVEIASALQTLYPGRISLEASIRLIGSEALVRAIRAGEDPRTIQHTLQENLKGFLSLREKYLLYK
jgi:uncharacterized protein YbbC (DUF1343 family)/CubicO group peptidase (beta-lactamase class C family)